MSFRFNKKNNNLSSLMDRMSVAIEQTFFFSFSLSLSLARSFVEEIKGLCKK